MTRKRIALAFLLGLVILVIQGWNEAKKPGRFPLQEIRLLGVVYTPVDQAMQVIDIKKGTNLLRIDPREVQERLSTLSWVRSVRVKRLFPSTLVAHLVEKIAVGTSREKEQLFLLDEYGVPIKPLSREDPLVFPVVVPAQGKEKSVQVVRLLNLLGKNPWLHGRISEAVGLTGGSWTLYTKRGVKLLLSKQPDQELKLLKRLQDQYSILDRRIRQVELRIPGRAAVRFAL